MIRTGALIFLVAALGCSNSKTAVNPPAEATNESNVMNRLASSVGVEVGANNVRMVLHVTNPTNQPVTLEFTSGQRYDFAVRTADGTDVWRWSADRSFMQALQSQTIAPGATIDFAETWEPGSRTGNFIAIAELVASNHPLKEQTEFQIRR